ncbi:MAG: DUF4442 domain-containing protein [Neisseriaceae bacterium]|nr:DUF4442 domain-containing protein [Neisseriaceae bacterium]
MRIKNRMSTNMAKFDRWPRGLGNRAKTFALGRVVPFLNTAGLVFDEVSCERVSVRVENRRKVQNHIKGVHATAMALLAETATGFVVGMNTPDDKLMLLKSMTIHYTKRSVGAMSAVATLSDEMAKRLQNEEKGDFVVPCLVTDESGEAPIEALMCWAWVPKKRPE